MPFNLRDKYETWWNRLSDFALDLFPSHPLFYRHLLGSSNFMRGGLITRFEVRNEGLYAEASVDDNEHGLRILKLIDDGVGAWSSGTLPHLIKVNAGGYVRRWPIVEGSVVHRNEAGSLPHTTTVSHIRSIFNGVDLPDDNNVQLVRSVLIMPENNGNNPQNPPAPAPVAPQVDLSPVLDGLSDIRTRLTALEEASQESPPLRQMPENQPPPTTPSISVGSEYDDVSLWGMLFYDQQKQARAGSKNVLHRREERFMRAIVDKMAQVYAFEEKQHGDFPLERWETSPVRCVDSEAYEAWHKKVPHLRANEAMQSTLAGSGDELVPTLLSSVAYFEFRLASRVFGLIPSFQMPGNPFNYPKFTGSTGARQISEATDRQNLDFDKSTYPDAKPTTGSVSFNAGKIGVMSIVSKELFEDAGINVANAMATTFARDSAKAIDDVILNGDERTTTANISHSADPTGTVYDRYLALDGLRRLAQSASDTKDYGAALDVDDITELRELMGSRGIIGLDLNNLVAIASPGLIYDLLVLSNFKTMEQMGQQATQLTGQVGQWMGVPLIGSDELELCDGDGKYPATHTGVSDEQLILLHRQTLMLGLMRGLEMESGMVPFRDMYAIKWSIRMDVQQMENGGVAWGYDFTA